MNINKISLIIIVVFAAVIRLIGLGSMPSGFHNDEVMNGYVGRFTLQNGVDLYGNRLPLLYFDNFGDYPNILPMYLSGISTYIFGVNPFAVRFPIAVFGALTVGLIYLLAKKIFSSEAVGLISAFILAVSPWHIILSRATAEGVTAAAVFLTGLLLLLRYMRNGKLGTVSLASLLFLLTYFLYPSYRVFIPLILWPAFLLAKHKSGRIILLSISLVFTLLTAGMSQTVWGKGRYDQTSVFGFNDVLKIRITQEIFSDGGVPVTVTRFFHNKIWKAGREILDQYFSYWSGSFLFVRGGLPGRYLLGDQGLAYISLGVLCIIGLLARVINRKAIFSDIPINNRPLLYYFLFILMVSPLPAAMTLEDAPNVHRSLLMGILLPLLFGYFIWQALKETFVFKKLILSGLGLFFAYELLYFAHMYIQHSTVTEAPYRNTESSLAANYILDHKKEYQAIYAPQMDQLPLRMLFEEKRFDSNLAGQFTTHIYIQKIDSISFSKTNCPGDELIVNPSLDNLLISRVECSQPSGFTRIDTIKRADGHDAYAIYSNVKKNNL